MTPAVTSSTWSQIIVAISIFLPVAVTIALAWVVLRGKKHDPDEQRWRRLEEQRRSESDER